MEEDMSPLPKKKVIQEPETMTFPEAMEQVIKGKKITRIEWDSREDYGLLKDGFLLIHNKKDFHKWMITDGDLLATDWVILVEPN